ncbi:lytic polysaccharide monooxygenase [Bipolaris maydis]|nr:lytic polysaccharide monooxygenase [Bipolaris maydis]
MTCHWELNAEWYMTTKSAWAFVLILMVRSHVFVAKLIMLLNGDLNYHGPGWGQQPFPCKGYYRDVTHHEAHITWYTGSMASFSYDNGETWIVVQSWEGNCVRVRKGQEGKLTNSYDTDQSYSFDIPASLLGADTVIFAWTWLNVSGNREFYMSCSPVRLILARSLTKVLSGYPMYIANLQENLETLDLQYTACQIRYVELGDDGGLCGLDNQERVRALALQSS